MNALLTITDLKVRYGGAEVLKGVSLTVGEGEIVMLIGSNGAGKTTTLRTISGLKRACSGEVLFEDRRIDFLSPQDTVKAGIGHVPQGRALFPYLPVKENLLLGAYLRQNRGAITRDMERVFEHFPVLGDRKRQLAGTLSGGEQQMLAIARALMGRPKLLMLDEPSLALSPILIREIGRVVVEINRAGTSILLVEQNAHLAFSLAQRGYVLETGQIVESGSTAELMSDNRVKRAYLGR
ncbi:MAG: ABC transporter ATP-binding protein [Deltaproteobacteria bacterium]|nr:ABC transporter ATP-binding protein [Deltaproteobacteria bacterium]